MRVKILITGASGGFGQLIVATLLQKGHDVAATMRDTKGKNKDLAGKLAHAGAKIIELDVTDEESVRMGVRQALTELNGLDVVINNAGVGVLGMSESFTPEDFRRLFDINVFGVQRVNRAILPYFREKKQGLIIYTSSLLGRIALPFYGPYQASKWALEALAENYRVELSSLGIENCIIEPGGFPTSFAENLMRPGDQLREKSYGDLAKFPEQMLLNFDQVLKSNPQQDPQRVADTIADLIEKPQSQRPFRTPIDYIGMGNLIQKYNEQLEEIMTTLYTRSGINGMLHVAPKK